MHPLKTRLNASFFALCLILTSCDKSTSPYLPQQLDQILITGSTMGTSYHIKAIDFPDDSSVLESDIEKLLEAINNSMSTYISDSELNRLNASPITEPFSVSNSLCEVLSIAQSVYELSGGAFDPTIRPLVDVWGFGPESENKRAQFIPPSGELIEREMARVGFDKLAINCDQLQVTRHSDVTLDLSAVAKGYAVDQVAQLIAGYGLKNFMVEIGGEVRVAGINSQQIPWRIAVEKPNLVAVQQVQKVISLTNNGMATSGDYRNFVEIDGVRYSHTLDPKTGYPVTQNLASVTIIDPSVAIADALATAFMVVGRYKAMAIAEERDIPALFLVKNTEGYEEVMSTAFIELTEAKND